MKTKTVVLELTEHEALNVAEALETYETMNEEWADNNSPDETTWAFKRNAETCATLRAYILKDLDTP